MSLKKETKAFKRKKALDVLRKLKRKYPEMGPWHLKRLVAEELGVTERMVYIYLDEDG